MNDQPSPFKPHAHELPEECCAKCHFVLKVGAGEKASLACRFDPPALMFGLKPSQNLAGDVVLTWETASGHPPTQPARWCGQFKPNTHAQLASS